MKKFLLFFSLFFSAVVFAQSPEQQQILKETQSFMTFLEQKNYDKILEMSHPALTEKFEKQMMIDGFKMIFEGNDQFSMKLNPIADSAYKVSDVYKDGTSQYAFVSFPMNMEMTFKNQKFDADSKKMMVNMMEVQGMKAEFVNDTTLNISKLALTVALKDQSTNNQWKYINHDENNPFYTTIVPVEIIRSAKSYYSDLLLKQKENAN
ncbi:hypothetical protein MHJ94_01590 [Chryseobacterium taklimakanense]|uniref:hypothetical protein n=1 Tax=Chryseobacterium taklimakanense TaxID=536441 RepID=UPI001EF650A9|nr:hypothetical protein [Chryseobacterium taklimakanense]MCG7279987.1 hypothetical protein [Chryseobacterium taklimakanense]